MKNWHSVFFSLAVLFLGISSMRAQAIYAGTENVRIQAGVGGTYLKTDYARNTDKGLVFWGDYDFRAFIGLEGEYRLGGLMAPGGIGENSYLVGPRLLYRRRKFTGYGKLTVGRGTITNQDLNQSSSFNVYAYGGGLEYKVTRKLNLRAVDIELQKWPDFKPTAISPLSLAVGLSYVFR